MFKEIESETKSFTDAVCSKVGATGKREKENHKELFDQLVN
jgi:hypothetical protein